MLCAHNTRPELKVNGLDILGNISKMVSYSVYFHLFCFSCCRVRKKSRKKLEHSDFMILAVVFWLYVSQCRRLKNIWNWMKINWRIKVIPSKRICILSCWTFCTLTSVRWRTWLHFLRLSANHRSIRHHLIRQRLTCRLSRAARNHLQHEYSLVILYSNTTSVCHCVAAPLVGIYYYYY